MGATLITKLPARFRFQLDSASQWSDANHRVGLQAQLGRIVAVSSRAKKPIRKSLLSASAEFLTRGSAMVVSPPVERHGQPQPLQGHIDDPTLIQLAQFFIATSADASSPVNPRLSAKFCRNDNAIAPANYRADFDFPAFLIRFLEAWRLVNFILAGLLFAFTRAASPHRPSRS